jgi:O-antigen/teichoic acid export membrane protein
LSTTEHIPVVLLNALGFGMAIPGFELARKIASVPYVLIHALNMHMMPELVRTAGESAWEQFRRVLSRFTLLSGAAGCVYVAAVLLGLIGLRWMFHVNLPVDMAMFTILLGASIVTALGAPAGSALVALNGDSLWALAASVSLAVQLGVSLLALGDLGPLAIAASVLAQTIVLRGILAVAAATLLAGREKQREPVHVAS